MMLRQPFPPGFRILLAAFAMAVFGLAISSAVAADTALNIHIIADGHYDAKTSLAEFKDYLEKNYDVSCTASWGGDAGASRLDNLDELKTADLLLLFARRMNRAYVTDQSGSTLVFKPNPEKLEVISKNNLDEHSNSTPAISNGQLFIRTFKNLWCIESK